MKRKNRSAASENGLREKRFRKVRRASAARFRRGIVVLPVKDVADDAVWEAYLAGFDSLNLTKILQIRQGALDRYEAR